MARSLNLNQLTLRDKIREAARRAHDLNEHLEQAFVPKVHELRKLVRRSEQGIEVIPVSDTTVRHHAAIVIDSEQYTANLDDDATALFEAIVEEVGNILTKKR
ncbi:MAG: hypothetical protein WCJ09_19810 [Planctomycetota bacterium]